MNITGYYADRKDREKFNSALRRAGVPVSVGAGWRVLAVRIARFRDGKERARPGWPLEKVARDFLATLHVLDRIPYGLYKREALPDGSGLRVEWPEGSGWAGGAAVFRSPRLGEVVVEVLPAAPAPLPAAPAGPQ